MVYQALLFSTDEKTSRVVNQILGELEFHVEICAEPFAAVKQITSQHYDALVVDCDNEQNATLLFKSARNSNSNGGSLAVALVQGQSGISKAFRIGANLVLTKPIHVEQSKGTLRTAKGLLRKAEAAKANSAPLSAHKSDKAATSFQASESSIADTGSATAAAVGMALELQPEQYPELGQAEAALLESMSAPLPLQLPAAASEPQVSVGSVPTQSSESPAIPASMGSAAAAAPAKTETAAATSARDESPVKELGATTEKEKEKKKATKSPSSRRETFAKSTQTKDDPLTFAGSEQPGARQAEPAGNKRNLMIAAVLVLGAAGAVYYGWPQLQPLLVNLPIVQKYFPSQPAPAPAVAPTPAPAPVTGTATGSSAQPATAGATGDTLASPTSASVQNSSPAATANQPAAAGKSADGSTNPSSDGSAQQPLHVTSEASAALLLSKTDPVYPPSAMQQHIEGPVSLQFNIEKDGTISHLKVLSGKPLLATAAAAAVRQWKYKPYQLNGQPTEVQTEVTVDFKLPKP